MGQHVFFDQVADMIGGARGYIGQASCSFKLELGNLVVQKLDEHSHQVGVNHSLDWRIVFNGKESTHADEGEQLDCNVF